MSFILGYYTNLDDSGKFGAEIRTPDYILYQHDAKHSRKVSQGYSNEWIITDENPSRSLFIGEDLEYNVPAVSHVAMANVRWTLGQLK
jgi:hypothetical protein